MAGHPVKCYYCGQVFNRDKEPFVVVPNTVRRYSHKECFEISQKRLKKEEDDKVKLEDYIKKLFKVDFVPSLAKK